MYLTDKSKNFESDFEEAKKQLQELHEHSIIFEELENIALFETENSKHIENQDFIKTHSLISEIQEKQEITNRINSLIYNIGWLKSSILVKDDVIMNKAINNIMKDKHCGIDAIVSELNLLKNKIGKFEALHTSLLKNSISLDAKTLLEQDFREKHKKLNDFHSKQKNLLLNLSDIFVKLTKESVSNNKNK